MLANVLDRIGNTPLVRLDRVAAGLPVPVYGKCEFLNPGGSIKDRSRWPSSPTRSARARFDLA